MRNRFILKPLLRTLFAAGLVFTAVQGFAAASGDSGREAASWCAGRCDRVVTDWSLTAYQVINAGDGYVDPMAASRSLAMHDAVNTVQKTRVMQKTRVYRRNYAADGSPLEG
jgi:hypothetical protein